MDALIQAAEVRGGDGPGRAGTDAGDDKKTYLCNFPPHLCLPLSFISAHFLRQQPENGVLNAGISDIKAFRRERPRGVTLAFRPFRMSARTCSRSTSFYLLFTATTCGAGPHSGSQTPLMASTCVTFTRGPNSPSESFRVLHFRPPKDRKLSLQSG